jgi:hypothetical protein
MVRLHEGRSEVALPFFGCWQGISAKLEVTERPRLTAWDARLTMKVTFAHSCQWVN